MSTKWTDHQNGEYLNKSTSWTVWPPQSGRTYVIQYFHKFEVFMPLSGRII